MTDTTIANGKTYNFTTIKTESGKTVKDFIVAEKLYEKDKELIMLILISQAMNDDEKQYWFNLSEVMSDEQLLKLYDILRREQQKIKEIEEKYATKEPINQEELLKRAEESKQKRKEAQQVITTTEAKHEEQEKNLENEYLNQLQNL